jgi:hypothetical protein
MTQTQFAILCNEYLIEPCMALENDDVVKAIKSNDVQTLKDVLENQF